MTTLTRDEAAKILTHHVEHNLRPGDVVDFFNELFPDVPTTQEQGANDQQALLQRMSQHMRAGLEVEEILDLWKVAFPGRSHVFFDEETDTINIDADPEPSYYSEE